QLLVRHAPGARDLLGALDPPLLQPDREQPLARALADPPRQLGRQLDHFVDRLRLAQDVGQAVRRPVAVDLAFALESRDALRLLLHRTFLSYSFRSAVFMSRAVIGRTIPRSFLAMTAKSRRPVTVRPKTTYVPRAFRTYDRPRKISSTSLASTPCRSRGD